MTEKKTSEQLYGELFSRVRLASGESMQETQALLANYANAIRSEAAADLHRTADAAYLRDVKDASETRRVFWLRQDASAAMNGILVGMGERARNIGSADADEIAYAAFGIARAMRAEFEKIQIEERER